MTIDANVRDTETSLYGRAAHNRSRTFGRFRRHVPVACGPRNLAATVQDTGQRTPDCTTIGDHSGRARRTIGNGRADAGATDRGSRFVGRSPDAPKTPSVASRPWRVGVLYPVARACKIRRASRGLRPDPVLQLSIAGFGQFMGSWAASGPAFGPARQISGRRGSPPNAGTPGGSDKLLRPR